METLNLYAPVVDIYKSAVKASFDALSTFTDQSEELTGKLLESVPSLPEEGKKFASLYFSESKKGQALLKKLVETNLDIDWMAQEAPQKSLEALEKFNKGVFKEAAVIQKEVKPLVDKVTEQLPKEVKELVEYSEEAVKSGSEKLQENVIQGFETAKKSLADISATGKKASK